MPVSNKPLVRKNTAPKKPTLEEPLEQSSVNVQNNNFKSSRNKKILYVLILIFIAAIVYYFKGFIVAAQVNGQFITRIDVIKELEKQYGKQALEAKITKILIMQEAAKENVKINQSEVNKEIARIEKSLNQQGETLDQALLMRGMAKQDLADQIILQKTVEKIAGKGVNVTDKEINDYMQNNKLTIPEGTKPEDAKNNVKQQLHQQKISEKVQAWVQDLQKKAKINYFVKY